MSHYRLLILGLFYWRFAGAVTEFPEGFKRCKRVDPEMDKCVLEAANLGYRAIQYGVPNLDMPPVQNLQAPPMRFVLGNEAIGFSFVLELSDGYTNHTLKKYNKAQVNFANQTFVLDGLLKNLTYFGRYKMHGQFFVGSVKGQGKFTSTLHDVTFYSVSTLSKHLRDGKIFWQLEETRIQNIPKKITLYAEDIVPNKAINDAINKVINDNWRPIITPYYDKIDKIMGTVLQNFINLFLNKVPDEDLFL